MGLALGLKSVGSKMEIWLHLVRSFRSSKASAMYSRRSKGLLPCRGSGRPPSPGRLRVRLRLRLRVRVRVRVRMRVEVRMRVRVRVRVRMRLRLRLRVRD